MNRDIDYEALTKRLERTIKIAKNLGLQIIPCGGYAMDYSMDRLPSYPVGLFGALSIIEGPGARSRLGLTYLQTTALEEGFNSVQYHLNPIRLMKKSKHKKDATWLRLEEIGREIAKKSVKYTSRSSRVKKKKASSSRFGSGWSTTTRADLVNELSQDLRTHYIGQPVNPPPAPPSITDMSVLMPAFAPSIDNPSLPLSWPIVDAPADQPVNSGQQQAYTVSIDGSVVSGFSDLSLNRESHIQFSLPNNDLSSTDEYELDDDGDDV